MINRATYLTLFSLLMFVTNLLAGGILVEPSVISVSGVVLGEQFELQISSPGSAGYFLTVSNTGDKTADYAISILSCKEYGCNPYFGYQDIPDVRWIETKAVSGKQLAVSRKGNLTEITLPAGEMINLEVILPLWIETEKKPASFFGIFRK